MRNLVLAGWHPKCRVRNCRHHTGISRSLSSDTIQTETLINLFPPSFQPNLSPSVCHCRSPPIPTIPHPARRPRDTQLYWITSRRRGEESYRRGLYRITDPLCQNVTLRVRCAKVELSRLLKSVRASVRNSGHIQTCFMHVVGWTKLDHKARRRSTWAEFLAYVSQTNCKSFRRRLRTMFRCTENTLR